MTNERAFALIFASVYPHYVKKAETKGRTKDELHEVIRWLTGYTQKGLEKVIEKKSNFRDFFDNAPKLNPNRSCFVQTVAQRMTISRTIAVSVD